MKVLDKWLEAAGIDKGRVFRSFWRGGQSLRVPLSVPPKNGDYSMRAMENIVGQYLMVTEHGKPLTVHPHDLLRADCIQSQTAFL